MYLSLSFERECITAKYLNIQHVSTAVQIPLISGFFWSFPGTASEETHHNHITMLMLI